MYTRPVRLALLNKSCLIFLVTNRYPTFGPIPWRCDSTLTELKDKELATIAWRTLEAIINIENRANLEAYGLIIRYNVRLAVFLAH